jgi:hypothetical protein
VKAVLLRKSGDENNPEMRGKRGNNVWATSGGENYDHCLLLYPRYPKNLWNGPHNLLSFRRKKVLTCSLTIKNLNKQGSDASSLHSRSFGVSETRDSPIKNCDTSLSHAEHARLITRQRLLNLFQIIVVI